MQTVSKCPDSRIDNGTLDEQSMISMRNMIPCWTCICDEALWNSGVRDIRLGLLAPVHGFRCGID